MRVIRRSQLVGKEDRCCVRVAWLLAPSCGREFQVSLLPSPLRVVELLPFAASNTGLEGKTLHE
jgi:hypothetical protein